MDDFYLGVEKLKLLHFSGVNEDEMLSWGLRSL